MQKLANIDCSQCKISLDGDAAKIQSFSSGSESCETICCSLLKVKESHLVIRRCMLCFYLLLNLLGDAAKIQSFSSELWDNMLQFCEGHGVTFGHAMHPVTINTAGRGREGRNWGWEAVRAKKGSHRQIKKCWETRAPSGCYVMTFSKMIFVSIC